MGASGSREAAMTTPAQTPDLSNLNGKTPMIGPDGHFYAVPLESQNDAVQHNYKPAVLMTSDTGEVHAVPHESVSEALAHKWTVGQPPKPDPQGGWSTLGSDIWGALKGAANQGVAMSSTLMGIPNEQQRDLGITPVTDTIKQTVQNIPAQYKSEKEAGYSAPYRALAPVASAIGVNVPGMEESAKEGDVSGVVGHAAAVPVMMAATAGLAKGAGAAGEAVAGVGKSPVPAVLPETGGLPEGAISGAEKVFRAAAPTGGDPGFRSNVYAAAGDLAEVGRTLNLDEAKGGIINPDLRFRATVNALNDHLQGMYENERAPQIARNADAPVQLNLDADAKSGLQYLSRRAGEADSRSLAASVTANPTTSLANVDQLARVVNQELLGYESMTPAERAASAATNQRLAGLKALDRQLGDALNTTLEQRGETGVLDYERRYAAVSQVRDRLQQQMNAVELNQPGVVKAIVRPVMSAITGGKTNALGAASVADVNPGRTLQQGLQALAQSDLQPSRSGVFPAGRNPATPNQVPVAGLLPAPPIELGPSSATSPTSTPPNIEGSTRAQRLGLMLPEPKPALPAPGYTANQPTEPSSFQAPSVPQRGLGGKFQRVYSANVGPQIPGTKMGQLATVGNERWVWHGTRWDRITQ